MRIATAKLQKYISLPWPNGKAVAGRFTGLANAVEKQDLVAGINHRVNAFGKHGGTAAHCCGCKLGDRYECIANQGCIYDFF